MTRTFFPRGKFPRRNSVLKWVPRSIACKLDLANCTRECRSIPSNLIFQGLSRSSVDPWQVRANKFFHDQSYYTGSLCNVITSSYYIPIRYLSLEPPTVESAAIDWFALPFCTLRPFCPFRCRYCTWPRLQGSPPLPDRLSSEDYSNFACLEFNLEDFHLLSPTRCQITEELCFDVRIVTWPTYFTSFSRNCVEAVSE